MFRVFVVETGTGTLIVLQNISIKFIESSFYEKSCKGSYTNLAPLFRYKSEGKSCFDCKRKLFTFSVLFVFKKRESKTGLDDCFVLEFHPNSGQIY